MASVIDAIGGEAALKALVGRFYDLVETDPRGARLMALHFQGHGLSHVRTAQFEFLSGFFGGRRYHEERHGRVSLRDMHAHVEITLTDAENWLSLMDQAMAETLPPGPYIEKIRGAFRRAALVLVNQPEHAIAADLPPHNA